jgi:hypothetical protein
MRPRYSGTVVMTVGLSYAAASALEAFHGTDLFGVVPVDMRDRFVHPTLALLAALCLLMARYSAGARRVSS